MKSFTFIYVSIYVYLACMFVCGLVFVSKIRQNILTNQTNFLGKPHIDGQIKNFVLKNYRLRIFLNTPMKKESSF